MSKNKTALQLTKWEQSIFGVPFREVPGLLPGLIVASLLAWASIFISDYLGQDLLGFTKSPISAVMIAILLGLLIRSLPFLPRSFLPGFRFSVKKVLRLGIILLGIRLTMFDVLKLGIVGVPIVAICITGALLITSWINNKLNLPERLGTLIAVGTSICGVTAILAASPAIDADEEETAYAVAVITLFGLFATLAYPYLAHSIFSGQERQIGMFLGTAIHETAQVVGAGQIYADIFDQPIVLDIATITKLVRNVFMAIVIPVMAVYYSQKTKGNSSDGKKNGFFKLFPMFVLGFLFMAVIRSAGDMGISRGQQAFGVLAPETWANAIQIIKKTAEFLLVVALAGVGLNTDLKSFKLLGLKPLLVGLIASASVGVISFFAILLMAGFVSY
jgi:uncharacterized integral membrane protein (TIGR00698 family)